MFKLAVVALLVAVATAEECAMICTMDYTPVCGTDGVTYGNMCELTSLACLKRNEVTLAHAGECNRQDECNTICTMNYEPICGNDGVTYGNMCELTSLACLAKKAVSVAHPGAC